MKAVQIKQPGEAVLADVQMPVLTPGNAIIKVHSCGICGSDISTFRGINDKAKNYPLTVGHETSGEIWEIDENNEYGFKKGDRVVLEPYMYCGECYPCRQGRFNTCAHLSCLGVQVPGSMCEYFSHPINQLSRIPDEMTWELAAMVEPLVIGLHSIHSCQLKAGEHIAVSGAGTIGLLVSLAAIAYDAIPILIDVVPERLERAKSFGVKYTINSAEVDPVEEVMRITDGMGAECCVDASGANVAIRNTFYYSAFTGRIAYTGWPKKETTLPTDMITTKELQIRGSRNGCSFEFKEAIELINSGKVPAQKILTKAVPFEELPGMFKEVSENPGEYLKVVGVLK